MSQIVARLSMHIARAAAWDNDVWGPDRSMLNVEPVNSGAEYSLYRRIILSVSSPSSIFIE